MSANGHCFVEWKEEFVSQERGNRVVHYLLKDSGGESVLAVIGTERSLRHMFYVVADDFLQVWGGDDTVQAGFKWRSRREVVDWLTSMLSKQRHRVSGDINTSSSVDSSHAKGCPMTPESGSGARAAYTPECRGRLARKLKGHRSDIEWSGVSWTCGKHLKHYPSFCRNGAIIPIQSFVFIMAKEEDRYLAYLEDLYEDRKGQKKVKVRWFHHNEEVKGVIPLRNFHPQEVFITPYSQVISAECVDGLAVVLTPGHYEKCLAIFSPSLLSRVHLCFRQFKSNRVKAFDLSKMRGYFDQKIFSCLDPHSFLKHNAVLHDLAGDSEEEEFSQWDDGKKGSKRTRSWKGCQRILIENSSGIDSSRGKDLSGYGMPYSMNLRHILSNQKSPCLSNMNSSLWCSTLFAVDEKVEVLCQDSGIRGCWFRCTVLQVSRKQVKVQYVDLQDEDGGSKLEVWMATKSLLCDSDIKILRNLQNEWSSGPKSYEWVPASRPATPDKLGMRCMDRLTLRPARSTSQNELSLQIGSPVDAWWSDGWWEGVITGIMKNEDDSVQVYFPGENLQLSVHKKNLRISRDWVGDQWFDVETKLDILSLISASVNTDSQLPIPSTAVKDAKCDDFATSYQEVTLSTKFIVVKEMYDVTELSGSRDAAENMDCGNEKKCMHFEKVDERDDNESQETNHVDVVALCQDGCEGRGGGINDIVNGEKEGCNDGGFSVVEKDGSSGYSAEEINRAVLNSEAADPTEVAA